MSGPTPRMIRLHRDLQLITYYSHFIKCFRFRGKFYDFRGSDGIPRSAR